MGPETAAADERARGGQHLGVQTFLPYPDLRASSVVLDDRRLGKQRVETFQILRALTFETYAWRNHPAVRMWRGFVPGLARYGRENCREWIRRGYADTLADKFLDWTGGVEPEDPPLPPWFGWEPLHRSHRIALLRKEPESYHEHFPLEAGQPAEAHPVEGYVWPPDVFPTWPVRGDGLPLPAAVRALGFGEARPAQAAAVQAAAGGHDVLLVMRPGTGGSAAGLLAGLTTKGLTWWVSPPLLPRAGAVPAVVAPAPRKVAAGDPAPLTARPPGPADLLAMRAEA
ncbi:MAG TPA: MSMEG_6728 family protein, partial [Sporichthya sp.]|nr:MSMEG_6728 family protein [Sporichthya sp.]